MATDHDNGGKKRSSLWWFSKIGIEDVKIWSEC